MMFCTRSHLSAPGGKSVGLGGHEHVMRKESHVHYVKILITKYKDNVRNASWLGRLIGITFSLLRSSPLDAMYILGQQPDVAGGLANQH